MSREAWRKLFDYEVVRCTDQYTRTGDFFGFFSVPRFDVAGKCGDIINSYAQGRPCLDVGCGAYHRPIYMHKDALFYGIDPDYGILKRDFPFVQAMGEELPFRSSYFACVTMMSILDHALDPDRMLLEAYRVLIPDGHLFIWYRNENARAGEHLHFFNFAKIAGMLTAHHFSVVEQIYFDRNPRAGYPDTVLAIGKKVQ